MSYEEGGGRGGNVVMGPTTPTGFTIKDQNQTEDVEDLISLANSEAVRSAGFEFIELTLDNEVSVAFPRLVTMVSNFCICRKGIRVLVLWIPCTYKSGVKRVGLGCHTKDILNRVGRDELPCRLDVLDDPLSETRYTWPNRRVPTSCRWDPCQHELGRWRFA